MNQLVLATQNNDKVGELRVLLGGLDLDLLSLDRFPAIGSIEEDAETLEGNALKKARETFRFTGLPTLADDSGLEVRYLNDAPGVRSSRYAGPGATYADNRKKLLENLRGVPTRRRGARFRCVLAFVAPGGVEHLAEGSCRGVITESDRGEGGFGYDPVFMPVGQTLTFGEMEESIKNQLSHRARAAANIREFLRMYFLKH